MLETLILLPSQYSNTEIAEKLGISSSCLKRRLQNVYDIFEVKTREESLELLRDLMRL